MPDLGDKKKMDKDAEQSIKRVLNRAKNTLDLFIRNQGSGSTTAIKAGIAYADFPLLLTGQKDQAKSIAKKEVAKGNVEVESWHSISAPSAKGTTSRQILTDNSFMIRAFDSIKSVLHFMYSEIKRLRTQNDHLRDANERLARINRETNQELNKVKESQEELQEEINNLKEKLSSYTNGSTS